jgi:hypothetical protein
MPSKQKHHRDPILPLRIRDADRKGGFAFIPNRFLHDGFLASLTDPERSLYLLLVLAADRNGVSFYGFDKICSILELPLEDFIATRNSLIEKNLIAYDGRRCQVLSLPHRPHVVPSPPLKSDEELLDHDPATIRQCIRSSLGEV